MDESSIRRYARRLRVGVIAVFAIVVALIVYARLGLNLAAPHVFVQSRSGAVGGYQVSDGALVLLGIALFWLTEALRDVGAGGLFSRVVVRRFRLFALWLLIMAIYSFVAPLIVTVPHMLTPGRHRLPILLDLRDLLLLAITLLLFLVARLLERAGAIEREMSEIV